MSKDSLVDAFQAFLHVYEMRYKKGKVKAKGKKKIRELKFLPKKTSFRTIATQG